MDTDGDGVSNWREYKQDSNPVEADNVSPSQSLLCETWFSVPGNRTKEAAQSPLFPSLPDEVTHISNVNYGNRGENFTCRLRGYVVPPVDGEYQFFVAGDDEVELWLSPSGSKFSKKKYASVNSYLSKRYFDKNSAQHTDKIALTAGQKCYFEVIHKQGIGDSHIGVAWKIPGRQRDIILAEHLRPYEETFEGDADADDLPDSWEREVGLSTEVSYGEHSAWGDPDGDMLNNLREFQLGSDPLKADVEGRRGYALWETWENLRRDYVSDLIYSPKFPQSPDHRRWVEELRAPADYGNNYGSRLRAVLVAPESGSYTFWVAGNNQAQLYLSTDEKKFSKRLIASVKHYTQEDVWNKYGTQQSKPINLVAGEKYFVEILQKEGGSDDHVAVSWKTPNMEKDREIIGGEHLIAFERDPEDMDDDDLPDAWEIANGLDPNSAHKGDGSLGDLDGDGLTNREEFLAGTSASMSDTDGDGLSDSDELFGLGTDPLVANEGVMNVESAVGGGRFSATQGFETVAGEIAHLTKRQGELTYTFTTQSPGPRIFQLEAQMLGGRHSSIRIPATVSIDGILVAEPTITSSGGRPTTLSGITPYLASGEHSFTIEFLIADATVALQINQFSILQPTGEDADGNGIADWLDIRRGDENFLVTEAETSAVSPVCLEGSARFPSLVTIRGKAASLGVSRHWYADVELSPDGTSTKVSADFDNASIVRSIGVAWTETDVSEGGSIDLRVGDSLRLSAGRLGRTVAVEGGETANLEILAGRPGVFTFRTPGIYKLTALGAKKSLRVHAHRADFGEPLFLYSGLARFWETPGVSGRLAIEPDTRIDFTEVPTSGGVSRKFRLLDHGRGSRRVLARLPANTGNGYGAVVGAGDVRVNRMLVDSVEQQSVLTVASLEDGSTIVRTAILFDAIPPGGYIEVSVQVTGVTFLDGTTVKRFTAEDIGADGAIQVDMIRPSNTGPSICHTFYAYDADGQRIGF